MNAAAPGRVAVVTGGSRGIGRAIVKMLAQLKYPVAFNYHHSKQEALDLEKEINASGIKCRASCVDIKDFEAVKKWIEEVKKEFGRLDILVNNAGITIDKALMLMSPDDWREVLDTNLTGVFNATRACIVTFLKQKEGEIINISSVSGLTGLARQVNYSASKGGVNAFTKALAKEVAAYNIRVNAVAPGYIETDILSGFNEEQRGAIVEQIPAGRIGSPDDVANCVKFLLSPWAGYITGEIVAVDGGLTMR